MVLQIIDHGRNNTVEINQAVLENGSGILTLTGDGNVVSIAASNFKVGISGTLGHRSVLRIGADLNCGKLSMHLARDGWLEIGAGTGCNGAVRMLLHEAGTMKIGAGCLIASDVDISISDVHSVVDATTLRRMNYARDVELGDRVWIGKRVLIMKGVSIGNGSIIGAGSIVTGHIPANCSAAGNPARVLRENVTWDARLL